MRVAYLFTTFPKLSERFFLREVQELRAQGLEFGVYSMIWGRDQPDAGPVVHFRGAEWILMLAELLVWLIRRPLVSLRLLGMLNPFLYRSAINWGENALGLAFAFRFARAFSEAGVRSHGTWATAPGMAAFAMKALAEVQYTMEAHAYDIYRKGGDAHLVAKLEGADRIRSSTESAASELRRRLGDGASSSDKVFCVRRGLTSVPDFREFDFAPEGCFRFLSVGRLIEKKGYSDQLRVFKELHGRGFDFQASIIGGGPLETALKQEVEALGLAERVHVVGKLDHEAVDQAYREADALIFYGRVSESGDRDGFPNVIGEAMGHSIPVFSTDVAGTTEVIREGITGFLLDGHQFAADAEKIIQGARDHEQLRQIGSKAHGWVVDAFSVSKNASKIKSELWG